ncbi:thioredoxin family protein [Marinifilum caeruleilacunae]|uniref:Thioredoxin n=1 Tax=Marinifilum caeruleilacunae TaxID=2499076 RepID=A0ABX1WTI0_9BACT|nr:thioredoxin family protein [Marinifilum caeruleilacunae]NOU59317.1 thioredoxin [Marinifilum caeruleilacunae]
MKNLFKMITAVALAICCSVNAEAQNRSVEFEHTSWKKVLKKAKKEDKLIFVDCYTSWCGPCKMMAKDVFTQDHVADYFNSNFVNFKIDMEKGEGPTLKPGWKINAYPTFLVINSEGEVIHRVVGAFGADEFITYIKDAQDPDKNFAALSKAYEAGQRDGEFMFSYLRGLRLANLDKEEARKAKKYIASLSKDALLKKENWNIIKFFMKEPLTDEFRFVVENREKYAEMHGAKEIDSKIYTTYNKKIESFSYFYPGNGREYDKAGFDRMIQDLQSADFPKASELIAIALKNEYQRLNDWSKYASVIDGALDFALLKNYEKQYDYFNSAASMIAKASTDQEMLTRALRWASFAAQNESRVEYKSGYLATKANLLELVGNAEAAKTAKMESEQADKAAEKAGTKIISIPAFKMGGMKPAKKK